MASNFEKIKLYIKIAEPKKILFWADLFVWTIFYLLGLYVALPSSKAIISITIDNFYQTAKWLIIVMCIIIVQQVLLYLENRLHHKIIKDIWTKINHKMYDKIERASTQEFSSTSKEKITNIIYSNMTEMADFPRNCAKYISYFVQLGTTICILIFYNWIVGISVVGLCIFIYLIKYFIHKKVASLVNQYYLYQDKSFENLSDNYALHTSSAAQDNGEQKRQAYSKNLEKCTALKYKFGMLYCFDQVWLDFACHLLVCILSIYMICLVKNNLLTITLYLIIANYLSQGIRQIMLGYDIISCINSTYISTLRIKTILDIKPESLLTFGAIATDNIGGEIIFTNVNYISPNSLLPNIDKFNMKIKKHSATLIYGAHNCGKRTIYKMLNRCIVPTSGTVTIDNINIYDFDAKTYKHNIAFIPRKTQLLNDSIMNNLLISGSTKRQIYQICKELGLHQQIVQLQKSYNTNPVENINALSNFYIYLLGIARAVSTNSEILVFYEFPEDISSAQKEQLKKILKNLRKNHTLLIFSHSDWAKFVSETIYNIENGKIRKINL